MGLATVGGIGIVILAIVLDRMTQSMGVSKRDRGNVSVLETGPVGIVRRMIRGSGAGSAGRPKAEPAE
jgi:glycine betaine/proline transport system permease protein